MPTLEWELEQWCAEGLGLGATGPNAQQASAAQSQHANATQAAAAARSLIGHQFDQFVKELRTEYSVAVTAVACRLFAALQQQPGASLPLALATPPPGGAYAAAGGAEAAEALSQHVAGALAALSSGLEAVMSALRGCVEPRVRRSAPAASDLQHLHCALRAAYAAAQVAPRSAPVIHAQPAACTGPPVAQPPTSPE